MEENRTILFYLETVGNAPALERALARVSGVLSVKVNVEEKILEYVIDEWASDYDVFTEVMRICAECGASIDFDRKVENEEQPAEVEVSEEQPTEESEALPEEVEEPEEPEKKSKGEEKKSALSERVQRIIELCVSVACCVVALFTKDIVQYIFLAISFAIAGYDALYEAFVKMTKKQFVSEELLITLAFFACIVLGYAQYAVIALLLYSLVAFARKVIREEIDKNPAFAKNPPKYSVVKEEGLVNTDFDKIEKDDSVILSSSSVAPFDGVLETDCEVEDFKGIKGERKIGERVFAGEKVLGECQVKVTALGEECEFGKYNAFVNNASNHKSPLAEKMQNNSQIYCIAVLALCLIIAFIPPIFSGNYVNGLIRWAYTASIIATVSGLGYYIFASEINILAALARGRKCKLGFAEYKSMLKIAKAKKVVLDYEEVLTDANGELKEDALGAVRELKDSKIKDIAILCSLSDSDAENVCKTLKIKEYYYRENGEAKAEQLNASVKAGELCVTGAQNFEKITCEKESALGAVVSFNCEKHGYNGDACISSEEIAYLPYAVKLAKRTVKIQKFNLVFGIAVKVVLAVLACLGLAQLLWAVLADSIVSVICAFNAFINSKEIY